MLRGTFDGFAERDDRGWLYLGIITILSIVLFAFMLLYLWPRPLSVRILNTEAIHIHITTNNGQKVDLNILFHTDVSDIAGLRERNLQEIISRTHLKEVENGGKKSNMTCYHLQEESADDVNFNYLCDPSCPVVAVTTRLSILHPVEDGDGDGELKMRPVICFNDTL